MDGFDVRQSKCGRRGGQPFMCVSRKMVGDKGRRPDERIHDQ
jgi:hypothetical protein